MLCDLKPSTAVQESTKKQVNKEKFCKTMYLCYKESESEIITYREILKQ